MSELQIHNYDSGNQPAGREWSTDELRDEFDVLGFRAPFVVVKRKSDGQSGTMEFKHHPRVYFDFRPTDA